MKVMFGVFFLYWVTGLSSKPILACDQHPGIPHERWLQFTKKVNAEDAAKNAAADSAPKADPEVRRVDRTRAPRPLVGK